MRQYIRTYVLSFLKDGEEKIIVDLRVKFEIKKSMRSFPNLAKIDVYNLNRDTISYIQTKDPLVILKAGYGDQPKLIFRGRIRNIFVNHIGVDKITTIYAGDGERDWQKASYNKTLGSNVSLNTTVKDIFSSFTESGETSIGSIEGITEAAENLLGQTLSGSSKDILDKLAVENDFQWSIQDGELIALGGDVPLSSKKVVIVNQETGMIGSPTITEIGADVTMLLNPELLPTRAFRIESDSQDIAISNLEFRKVKRTVATGLYRAYEVIFLGDNRGNNWVSKAKGIFVNV